MSKATPGLRFIKCLSTSGLPFGLSIALYRLEDDGRTLREVIISGHHQIAMHQTGGEALAGVLAEAVGAITGLFA